MFEDGWSVYPRRVKDEIFFVVCLWDRDGADAESISSSLLRAESAQGPYSMPRALSDALQDLRGTSGRSTAAVLTGIELYGNAPVARLER